MILRSNIIIDRINMKAFEIESDKQSINKSQKHNQSNFTLFILLLNGVTSLLGYYTILNALDYFQTIYLQFNVLTFFLLFIFIGYLITACIFQLLTKRISNHKIILIGQITTIFSLLLLFIISLILRDHQYAGFVISNFLCLLIGISGNFIQLGFLVLINFLSKNCVARYTLGTGVGGLFLTVIKMIMIAIFGASPQKIGPITIYFTIAIIIHVIDIFMHRKFIKISLNDFPLQNKMINSNVQQIQQMIEEQKQKGLLLQIREAFLSIMPYPLIIMLNFIITMALFPQLTFRAKLSMNSEWSGLLFTLFYGIGDCCGKYVVQIKNSFNKLSSRYLIFGRLCFIFTIIVLAEDSTSKDDFLLINNIYPFVNQFLFSFTNGIVVGSSFVLTFEKCPSKYKNMAGILNGIFLQLGLIIGIILSYPLAKIVQSY